MFIELHWKDGSGYRSYKNLAFVLNVNIIERIEEDLDGSAQIFINEEERKILYPKESYEEICDLLSEVK